MTWREIKEHIDEINEGELEKDVYLYDYMRDVHYMISDITSDKIEISQL